MLNTSFPPWPSYTSEEVEAVADVVRSNRVNYWTGSQCREFEQEFAAWAGAGHAIGLSNGTVALEACLKAAEIGEGDEVIVTPRSFFASASCVVAAGARPVFADVDRDTQNLTAETISRVVTPRTRAVIPVHLAGMPCDMDPIISLASAHDLIVIEDCAQAHGAMYRGRRVGSIADMGAWSFCQDKIITTGGEGGMVTTNDTTWWNRTWSYKDHGKSWEAIHDPDGPSGFRWVHETFGTNGRMSEIQAVIGRIQLGRMDQWTEARRRNAEQIWSTAGALPGLRVPEVPEWADHAAYKAYVFVEPHALKGGWDRERIMAEISARDVPCYSGSCSEIYLEKAFDGTGWRPRKALPVAHELGQTSLMFLVHPTLEANHVQRTCDALTAVMAEAVR
jgi:dTDP-4-amino-4,6-dideoxygalactose transaminase